MALFGSNDKEKLVSREPRDRILEKLAFASLDEQRKTRRWGIFFKTLMALYVLVFLVTFAMKGSSMGIGKVKEQHTAVVDISGVIADGGDVDADVVISGLKDAFEAENSKAVVMRINSPGGSPVQSSQIFDEIKRLRDEHPKKKVYAVVGDICASGGYFIAAAADDIYVNRSSLVGSIGVLMNGYGFVDTMKKLGVERRLVTAGENKGMLDPFSPLKEDDVERAKKLVGSIHDEFISAVQQGRGDRLKQNDDLFSGMVWTGVQALDLGLVDDFGDIGHVAREVVEAPKLVNYTPRPHLLEELKSGLGVELRKAFGLPASNSGFEIR